MIWKSRHFADAWHIRKEMKLIVSALFITLIIIQVYSETDRHYLYSGTSQIAWIYSFPTLLPYCWYVCICWTHKKNELNNTDNATVATNTNGLLEHLSNESGYERIMTHLQNQYAFEGLIFLTIMIQWQKCLIKQRIIGTFAEDMLIEGKASIKLPKSVPISNIVRDFNNCFRKNRHRNISVTARSMVTSMTRKRSTKHSNSEKLSITFDLDNNSDSESIGSKQIDLGVCDSTLHFKKIAEKSCDDASVGSIGSQLSHGSEQMFLNDTKIAEVFADAYVKVYTKFLNTSDGSPLEINVSGKLSRDSAKWYHACQTGMVRQIDIVDIWKHLVIISHEVTLSIVHNTQFRTFGA